MAEKPADTKSSEHKSPEHKSPEPKSFAQFLEEEPAPAETVTMVGSVARSTRKGLFVLTSGGQMLELPIDAVTTYRVVSEGPQQLVELQVVTSKIDSNRIFKAAFADPGHPTNVVLDHPYTVKEVITDPIADKHPHTDPIFDPVYQPGSGIPDPTVLGGAAGAQPFILATPHHASPEALLTQIPGGGAAQFTTVVTDIVTSVYSDRPNTSVYADPGGGTSVYADPGGGTSVYADPGGGTSVYADPPHTSVYADPPHTSVYADQPHTIKELAKDPIQDTIFNPNVPVEQFAAAQEAQATAGAALKPAFAEGVGTSVYADAGNTSVYADQPQTSVYADQPHTSVYADQHTSVYADVHTSVYADRPHTIKEMVKDPIQDAIFNPGVPVEQFAEAAQGAQAEAATALKPVFAEGVGTSVYADAGNTSVYADQPRTSVYTDQPQTSVYADQPQTSVYADPGGGTSVYADPGGGTSVYADPGGTSVYADPHTGVYADQPHTRKELVKDPIVDSLVANPVWNLPGMMF
jgi:hypothetical protein